MPAVAQTLDSHICIEIYRVYFVQRGSALVVLLAGGDKSTQDQDIRLALELVRNI